MSWRKVFRSNKRVVSIALKRSPSIVFATFANVIWKALAPYVVIYMSALIINELSQGRDPERLRRLVLITLVSAAVISLITALLDKWKKAHSLEAWHGIIGLMTEKLFSMDYAIYDRTVTRDLLDRIEQNREGGGWGFERAIESMGDALSSLFGLLGGIALTVSLFTSRMIAESALVVFDSPFCAIAVIIAIIALTLLAPALTMKSTSYWALQSEEFNLSNRLYGHFGYMGHRKKYALDMRIYRQDKICDKYNTDKESFFCSNGILAHFARGPMGLYSAVGAAVSVASTGIVYAFVCIKALGGAFGLGSVTQYVSAVTLVAGGMSAFVSALGIMRINSEFVDLIFELLDIPNVMYQGSLTVEKRRDSDYCIEFKNVSFKYPTSESYSLRNVNLKFKIGKKLAVVGMNGSGKTTFIKLLCRLYDPTEGEILLNGIDIRKYDYHDYMMLFSVVFQDFTLLSLKLGENIAASSKYDSERVLDCIDRAGFSEKLGKLKDGVDTYINNDYDAGGVGFSGGEEQKLAIARALYKDAPIIVLDEPTAALDPIAEAEIYAKFDKIAGDKTAIYISHRLSSCKFCDEIAVFDHGSVVQHGTHDELLEDEGGKYCELWNAQAQYYLDNNES